MTAHYIFIRGDVPQEHATFRVYKHSIL